MFLRKEFFSSEKKVKKKKDLFIFYKPLCKGWLSIDWSEEAILLCTKPWPIYVITPPNRDCDQSQIYSSEKINPQENGFLTSCFDVQP